MATKRRTEDGGTATETHSQPQTKTRERLKHPRRYKVLLHNDDFTTMEFVVAILEHVFHHGESTAAVIMLHVHHHGIGVAGIYTFEVAETKVAQVMELARKAEFPLQCTMEPDDAPEEDAPAGE